MDRSTHKRFLTYREAWEYFREPGSTRLDVESWKSLDAELQDLLARDRGGALDPASVLRVRQLRKILLVD